MDNPSQISPKSQAIIHLLRKSSAYDTRDLVIYFTTWIAAGFICWIHGDTTLTAFIWSTAVTSTLIGIHHQQNAKQMALICKLAEEITAPGETAGRDCE